jgi:hypothetical protein
MKHTSLFSVLAAIGPLEWSRAGPALDEPNQDHFPPECMWRFAGSDGSLEAAVGAAVESFEGNVDWEVLPAGRNWLLLPKRLRGFRDAHQGMRLQDARDTLARDHPDFGRAANADIDELGQHIQARLIEKELSGPLKRHTAAALAARVCEFGASHPLAPVLAARLVGLFLGAIHCSGLGDILIEHVAYAKRIADAPGRLEYEEMHKLFTLRDEIEALGSMLGTFDAPLRASVDGSVRRRFQAEPQNARVAAEQLYEPWKSEWWWYAENRAGA